ncbi:hypothetical protein ACFY8X_26805 [Streptomyces tanashiensis]|uniref:hypothetical protein n=1 Tax=Streptomyces tanashiensis TaxID=67367 RepID=UPI0036EB806D
MSPDSGATSLGPRSTTCPICQGEFVPHPRQIYCSPRCKSAAHRLPPAPPVAHTCPVCQGIFTTNPRQRQIYCSPNCRRDAEKQCNQERDELRAIRLGEQQPRQTPTATAGSARQEQALTPTAVRNCPHCDQPVTIVALLATPEAARPTIASRVPEITSLRRTP